MTVTEAPASAAGTEATEDEGTEAGKFFFVKKRVAAEMLDDGEEDGRPAGETGADISSTASGDVDMLEAQDPETVAGSKIRASRIVRSALED